MSNFQEPTASPEEGPKRIKADPDKGLTSEQVAQRKAEGYDNKPVQSPSKTTKEIIADNTFTYFNLIFVVLGAMLIAIGCWRDISFIPIIAANSLIGIVQEMRSKAVLEKITVLNAPVTTVVRDGQRTSSSTTLPCSAPATR